jgi:hypothetical protein
MIKEFHFQNFILVSQKRRKTLRPNILDIFFIRIYVPFLFS